MSYPERILPDCEHVQAWRNKLIDDIAELALRGGTIQLEDIEVEVTKDEAI